MSIKNEDILQYLRAHLDQSFVMEGMDHMEWVYNIQKSPNM